MELPPASVDCCVVGAGSAGLTALKNLREEGFTSAIALDERPQTGGLWTFTEDPTKVSALRSTVANLSKQYSCYTDWPFPKDVPDHPSSADIREYLASYVENFGLGPHIKCGVQVTRILRDTNGNKWNIFWKLTGGGKEAEEQMLEADKVVIANGKWGLPSIPKLEGIEGFRGSMVHTQSLKNVSAYKGKRVLVIGFSNSGGDVTSELVGVASEIYLSHKYGGIIVPRKNKKGRPIDHLRTRRRATLANNIEKLLPNALDTFTGSRLGIYFVQRSVGRYPLSWGLTPKIPISRTAGVVINDYLLKNLHDGKVTILPTVSRIHEPDNPSAKGNTIEFINGAVIDNIDAIIYATGYQNMSYSSFLPNNDPTVQDPDIAAAWQEVCGREGLPLFRLFWNMFDLEHPTSFAFVGQVSGGAAAFSMFDVQAIAVAQVFAGKYVLPPKDELRLQTRKQNEYTIMKRRTAPILPGLVPLKDLLEFLDDATGSGMREHLSYFGKGAIKSWWWSLKYWKLSRVIMGGVDSPFVWRLFDGRRKKWIGAEQAIWEANV